MQPLCSGAASPNERDEPVSWHCWIYPALYQRCRQHLVYQWIWVVPGSTLLCSTIVCSLTLVLHQQSKAARRLGDMALQRSADRLKRRLLLLLLLRQLLPPRQPS